MIHVLYHSNCYDGFGSAYAAWKCLNLKHDTTTLTSAKYIPVSYGFPPPKLENENGKLGSDFLYILDFSYNELELLDLHKKYNCTIVVLDHHKTAKESLEPLMGKYHWLKVRFDMGKSGAEMSWEYFHDSEVPLLLKHIGDRDLWKFEIEGSKEIHKSLISYPMDFELWDKFDVTQLKREGVVLQRMYDQLVTNICKHSYDKTIDGHKIPVVNTTIAWSEVGHKLLENHPDAPFVASFTVFEDQIMWSLRSRKDFDVSEIAKKFGGGGHKQAAGFKSVIF